MPEVLDIKIHTAKLSGPNSNLESPEKPFLNQCRKKHV